MDQRLEVGWLRSEGFIRYFGSGQAPQVIQKAHEGRPRGIGHARRNSSSELGRKAWLKGVGRGRWSENPGEDEAHERIGRSATLTGDWV